MPLEPLILLAFGLCKMLIYLIISVISLKNRVTYLEQQIYIPKEKVTYNEDNIADYIVDRKGWSKKDITVEKTPFENKYLAAYNNKMFSIEVFGNSPKIRTRIGNFTAGYVIITGYKKQVFTGYNAQYIQQYV